MSQLGETLSITLVFHKGKEKCRELKPPHWRQEQQRAGTVGLGPQFSLNRETFFSELEWAFWLEGVGSAWGGLLQVRVPSRGRSNKDEMQKTPKGDSIQDRHEPSNPLLVKPCGLEAVNSTDCR